MILGEWTFDDGLGGADPQGWTTFDFTTQIDTFFHVDDFSGLNNSYLLPMEGTQSLWCGARAGDVTTCSYQTLPGYGNGWDQMFESTSFAVTGDVQMVYLIRYDTEASYDFVYVQYQSGTGHWNTLRTYNNVGSWSHVVTAPADSLDGSIRLRFRFQSDDAWSDEDGYYDSNGAVIVDMIEVSDATGPIDYQDFESEAVGALSTADGHWSARPAAGYGNHAGLFAGSAVVQEDLLVTNLTYLWGFFSGSAATYACGGHPEQLAVPYGKSVDERPQYINSGIQSPVLAVPTLTDTSDILLEFDVYRDLALVSDPYGVFYEFAVRSRVNGCWGPWRNSPFRYFGAQKDWFRFRKSIAQFLETGASEFQVAISAHDYGAPACHSHSPLVDNVKLMLFDGPPVFAVTNTNDSGPGSLRAALMEANGLTGGRVVFNIPGTGPHIISPETPLTGVGIPIIIDGTTQPGFAGTPVVKLTGALLTSDSRLLSLSPSTGISLVRGLELDGTGYFGPQMHHGMRIAGRHVRVEGCIIKNCDAGIYASGTGHQIGGPAHEEANTFWYNTTGIVVGGSAMGVTVRGNSIGGNTGLGIDLGDDGVSMNDTGDTDVGPNGLLNFPVLEYAVQNAVGGYITGMAGESYIIDFYASSCDPSGYGEGDFYLGSTIVTAQPDNQQSRFHATLPLVPDFMSITATATDAGGNTSEFSHCISPGYGIVVTSTANDGPGSLRQAIVQANAGSDMNVIRFAIPGAGP
ncbi:MAG: hypothetical protein OEV86_14635, partial [Candidatus Krumholzibacteria bacterium]|nr:hypothetical protein [Candidatus Krumholzibacteria bacterium]